ncbi:MAG: hypothetical protein K2X43_10735 [Hyphomonadaceae bacterium]|jgi:hypothetical protein|nr:hypothetical protein [Hyphomonadaceae bacterium]
MKSWVLAVGLLAAAFVPAAHAADMGDDESGSYNAPPAFNDRDDDYGPPPPAARRYSGPPYGRTCARSEQVQEWLTDRGWRDFHGGQPQGDVVTLRARRPSGRLFELTLHRCTGEIIEARPLEPRPFGPYAFNRPPPDYYDDRPRYNDRWNDDAYIHRDRHWWYRGH